MDLIKYQKLFLQTVYDYFREKADWPTYRQVEMELLPTYRDFNVIEVARSLVAKPYRGTFHIVNLKTPVYLSIDEIRQCPGSEKDLANLVKIVRYSANKYINSKENQVEITSEEIISELHMDNFDVRKVGLLISDALIATTTENNIIQGKWKFVASNNIARYDGVASIDEFFKIRDSLFNARNSSDNASVDPSVLIEKITQADPSDFKEIGLISLEISTGYYKNPLKQSEQSFLLMRIAAVVCLVSYIAAIAVLLFEKPANIAFISMIGGALSAFFGGIFFLMYRHASNQALAYKPQVDKAQNFFMAYSACENLEDEIKQTTRAKLIEKLND